MARYIRALVRRRDESALYGDDVGHRYGVGKLTPTPIVLVTDKALRVELRPFIEKEAVRV